MSFKERLKDVFERKIARPVGSDAAFSPFWAVTSSHSMNMMNSDSVFWSIGGAYCTSCGLALADRIAFQTADLSQAGPIKMLSQTRAGLQMPPLSTIWQTGTNGA
jgi:hypothetical protein